MARVARTSAEKRGRVPPQNLEAEQSLLAGVLIDPESMNKIVDVVAPDDFYREDHAKIFEMMLDLYEKSEPIDIVTMSSAAKDKGVLEKIGGVTYLNRLVDMMPTSANIAQYAKLVREKALLRSLMKVSTEIIEKGYEVETNIDGYVDDAERMIFQISEKKFKASFFAVKDLVMENVKTIERLFQKKQTVTGLPTGFVELDKLTSGLQPSDLIIVAGRPSMGKTAFCLNIAQNVALCDGGRAPVGVFSMEMSKEQLVMRLLSSESEVEFSKLRTGALSSAEWPKLAQAADTLYKAPIFIDDSAGLGILDLRARARRLKKEHDLSLLIIDYLQLMRGRSNTGGDRREQEISEISRFLKALAKELNIPVIAISQLNRMVEQREDKKPRLADLRESGAIEQDADLIMFIYRDEVYNKSPDNPLKGVAEIIIGKQRNGPTGDVEVAFLDKYTAFRNLYRE